MSTLFIGRNRVEMEEVVSTQDVAEGLLTENPPAGTLVIARHQSGGRGQQGNTWLDEPGKNLTFSLILYPRFLSAHELFHINRWASLAITDCIAALVPSAKVEIKWPNDILVNGKKICGMIATTQIEGPGKIKSVVVGIGLNVNQATFTEAIAGRANSLLKLTGIEFNLEKVLESLLSRLEAGYLALQAGKFADLEARYLRHLFGYGEWLQFRLGDKEFTARIAGVDHAGRLALEENGKLHYYQVKEVECVL